MFQIGASLAAAREARGLELRDAEQITCMRSRYLEALEQEHWDALPGRTYTCAFLRTYANALELDADAFVQEFDEQFPPSPEPEEQATTLLQRRRHSVPIWLASAAAVAGLVVMLVWSAWPGGGRTVQTNREAARPPAATTAPETVRHAIPHVRAAEKTLTHPALFVRALRGRCWVEVRVGGPAGAVLAERTLEQGQTLRLDQRHLWLRLGAPWNVKVTRGTETVRLGSATTPENVTA